MQIKDTVRVIGGNNEMGQSTMTDKRGTIIKFSGEYYKNRILTRDVFVDLEYFGVHVFSERYLEVI